MPLDNDGVADDECDDEEPKEVQCSCRCGACCRLIIEVDMQDAER